LVYYWVFRMIDRNKSSNEFYNSKTSNFWECGYKKIVYFSWFYCFKKTFYKHASLEYFYTIVSSNSIEGTYEAGGWVYKRWLTSAYHRRTCGKKQNSSKIYNSSFKLTLAYIYIIGKDNQKMIFLYYYRTSIGTVLRLMFLFQLLITSKKRFIKNLQEYHWF
jgi:hypothetical protein